MKLSFKIILLVAVLLILLLMVGPRPDKFEVDPTIKIPQAGQMSLDEQISHHEAKYDIRPGNEAKIIWADSLHLKTPYSLVYLHGFSASHVEGHPVHQALAQRYGMNLYLSRLHDHGIKGDRPLESFEADRFVESSKEAIQIGQQLGEQVIVIGTSTGATAALYLAAYNPELIDALLLYSPNIDVADPRSFLLTYPWGEQLAEFLEGEYLYQGMSNETFDKYWYPKYRTNSAVELLSLIEHTMTDEIFARISQPTFVSYYYKNESEKDNIISTEAIDAFYPKLGTKNEKKRLVRTPNSGNHVTISNITSKDIKTPFEETCKFLEEVCRLPRKDATSTAILLSKQLD